MKPLRFPLTIFYDASCSLCANEMRALAARDGGRKLLLVDCSSAQFDETVLAGTPIRRHHLMELIHARDAHGTWLIGLDVFEVAYAAAGLDRMAAIWGDARLRPFLGRLYPWIARNRQMLSRLGLSRLIRLVIPMPCAEHDCGLR